MKNILLNDFDDAFWIPVIKNFSEKNFNIHTVIDHKNEIPKAIFQNQIKCNFINITDAIKLRNLDHYYSKDVNINFLKKYDHFLIDMLSRFDSDAESFSYSEKKSFLRKSSIIWYNYIKYNKIDFFFSKYAPHLFYDYIIYLCCKKLNIKTIFFQYVYFTNLQFLNNDVDNRQIKKKLIGNVKKKIIYEVLKKRKRDLKKKNYEETGLDYIKKNKLLKNNFFSFMYFVLFFSMMFLKDFLLFRLYKESHHSFKKKGYKFNSNYKFTNLDFHLSKIKGLLKIRENLKYYNSKLLKKLPDKFVYFASNHQPEATSTTEAGIKYYNQIDAIKLLRKKIPQSFKIVYKAHPASFNPKKFGYQKRSVQYYKALKEIKGLEFIDIDFDSYKLIKNSELVATVAGQIGVECFLMNKICIVFSKTWYSQLDNIIHINNFNFNNTKKKKININQLKNILLNCLETPIIRNRDKFEQIKNDKVKLNHTISQISNYLKDNFKII